MSLPGPGMTTPARQPTSRSEQRWSSLSRSEASTSAGSMDVVPYQPSVAAGSATIWRVCIGGHAEAGGVLLPRLPVRG